MIYTPLVRPPNHSKILCFQSTKNTITRGVPNRAYFEIFAIYHTLCRCFARSQTYTRNVRVFSSKLLRLADHMCGEMAFYSTLVAHIWVVMCNKCFPAKNPLPNIDIYILGTPTSTWKVYCTQAKTKFQVRIRRFSVFSQLQLHTHFSNDVHNFCGKVSCAVCHTQKSPPVRYEVLPPLIIDHKLSHFLHSLPQRTTRHLRLRPD